MFWRTCVRLHRVNHYNRWHTLTAWLWNWNSTILWKWPGDKVSHTRRLEYSVKCDVQLFFSFSVDFCFMNVLERAYNSFFINYKACVWKFVSSEMLNCFKCINWPLCILKLHNGFILKGSCWHRKSHQLSIKAVYSFKTSWTTHPRVWCHIPEDCNFKLPSGNTPHN